jgi:hypothetical protein
VALALGLLACCAGILVYCFSASARSRGGLSLPRNINDAKSRWKLASAAAARGGMSDFIYVLLDGKIDTIDATLRWESLDQSIRRLTIDREQYSGYQGGSGINEQNNLERMLFSRRAVKVLQSIRALPAAEREAKCKQMFAQVFRVHTNAYRVILQQYENPSFPKKTRPTFATMALCAAMFAAAESGHGDLLADEFAQLDRFRDDLELRLFSRGLPDYIVQFGLLRVAQPDIRFQVNVLRLAGAVAPSANLINEVDQECLGRGMRMKKITIVGWDGNIGGMTYWFYDNDDQLASLEVGRGIVRKLRLLLLGQTEADPVVVIPALIRELTEEKTPSARCAAALALGRLSARRDPRVLSALIAALNDADPAVARCAGIALNGEQGVGGGMIMFSMDRDALVGLGAKADAAIPGLVRVLRDPGGWVRYWSAWVLQELGANGSPQATAALAGVLEDPSFTNGPGIRRSLDLTTIRRRPARTAASTGDGK